MLKAPTGGTEDNVNIVLSERRKSEDGSFFVYDAVFHPKIIEKYHSDQVFAKQLLDLATDCVEETFNIKFTSCKRLLEKRQLHIFIHDRSQNIKRRI